MALGDGKAVVVEGPDPVESEIQLASAAAAGTPGNLTIGEQTEQLVEHVAQVAEGSASSAITAVEAGLRKRWEFWKGKLANATEDSMVESATDAIGRIHKEAKAAGVDLMAAASAAVQALSTGTGATGSGKTSKKKSSQPRSVVEKEQIATDKAKRLAAQAADKPAGEAKAKSVAVPKAKTLRPCLDGCGSMVAGNFQMGHDAKLKSLLLKIERGEEDMSKVPEVSAGIIKFKKGELETLQDSKGTKTGTVQHYVLLAAPVKFHGRPDVQITQREA